MSLRDGGYGTIPETTGRVQQDSFIDEIDRERLALLGKPKTDLKARFREHMTTNVDRAWADVALLFCYTITGLLDSSSVFMFGAFASMQTGNTIYLGLGLVKPDDSTRWIRSIISIGSFCLGSFCFGYFHRYFSSRKRWVVVANYTIQLVLVTTAAFMVTFGGKISEKGPVTVWVAVPLALIAFQSAGQAVMSRVLQYNALTSVVLTTIYCDLFSDQNLFGGLSSNVDRNRRAAAPLLLLFGAILGGLWAHSDYGEAAALWTAVSFKALLIVAWMFWPAEAGGAE